MEVFAVNSLITRNLEAYSRIEDALAVESNISKILEVTSTIYMDQWTMWSMQNETY